jgi:hypothetical protein
MPLKILRYDGNISKLSLFSSGSTVGDVYNALKRGALPHVIVHGDFVRAEAKGLDLNTVSKKRQIGRDVIIDDTCCVIRIQTNRKSIWQQHQHHQIINKGVI